MNAPATITATQLLAAQIVAGDVSGLPRVDFPYYEISDFQDAAQSAVDGDDYAELKFMVQFQIDHDRFTEWKNAGQYVSDREFERREFTDFDAWRASNPARLAA